MATPLRGIAVWTFAPPSDEWTDQYIATWTGYPPETDWGTGYITDAYDFTQEAHNEYTEACYTWKSEIENQGWIHRVTCKFSITNLPDDASDRAGVITLGSDIGGGYYYQEPALMIRSDGKLELLYGSPSTKAISTGTLYDCELIVNVREEGDTGYHDYFLFIDDELWIEENEEWGTGWRDMQSYFSAGPDNWAQSFYNRTVTTHVQDIVWTMEDANVAPGRWTMMVPSI